MMDKILNLAGRVLLAQLFIITGYGKIGGFAGTQAHMSSVGVPGELLPLVILLEVGGGIAIIAGFMTRWVALTIAVFCVASALIFHMDFGDQMQSINFMKNFSIAGGFLVLAQVGAPYLSIDAMRSSQREKKQTRA